MVTVIRNQGLGSYRLFYASANFTVELLVTGYMIYPDLSKSSVLTFTEIGDGIYAVLVPYSRQTLQYDDKYGIVVKENGTTKYFGTIQMIN